MRGVLEGGGFLGKAAGIGAGHPARVETREPAAEPRPAGQLLARDAEPKEMSAPEHQRPFAAGPLAVVDAVKGGGLGQHLDAAGAGERIPKRIVGDAAFARIETAEAQRELAREDDAG